MSFLKFEPGPDSPSWYSPWRKYVFGPHLLIGAVYDSICLDEIGTFIRNQTEEHKRKKTA